MGTKLDLTVFFLIVCVDLFFTFFKNIIFRIDSPLYVPLVPKFNHLDNQNIYEIEITLFALNNKPLPKPALGKVDSN